MCSFKESDGWKKQRKKCGKNGSCWYREIRAGILVTFEEKNLILDTTGLSTGFILKIRDKGPEL